MNRVFCLVLIGVISQAAYAHFPMLLTKSPFVKAEEAVGLQFSVGHPYEREYETAEKPAAVFAVNSRGVKEDLLPQMKENKTVFAEFGKDINAWDISYTPPLKGSYVIALNTGASVSRDETSLYQEYIKTVIYAERGSGWDQRTWQPLEIVALTRPFGIQPGFVFRGRLMKGDQPVADSIVYIEHFMEDVPNPDTLPVEPLITFEVKTDGDGFFTVTLPDSGWWIVASYADNTGKIEHEGKTYQHNAMAGIWVHVE
jgi:uncharacterized GH25 family protein